MQGILEPRLFLNDCVEILHFLLDVGEVFLLAVRFHELVLVDEVEHQSSQVFNSEKRVQHYASKV
jgi:hypothetical protein